MKKLILNAVMMMAFVGTSMAKTGEVEVKEIDKKLIIKTERTSMLAPTDACDNVWRSLYIHFLGSGSSAAAAAAATKKADLHAGIAGC